MIDRELAKRIADYLNELHVLDPHVISDMVEKRFPCNKALASHPTCQVIPGYVGNIVGMLGVMNGLCGVDDMGRGAIAACYHSDNPNHVIGFTLLDED